MATQRCILWVALRIADRGQNHDYIHETTVIFLTAEAQRYSNSITPLWKCHPQQWLNPVEHMGFGKPREKKEGKNKIYQWSLYFIRKKNGEGKEEVALTEKNRIARGLRRPLQWKLISLPSPPSSLSVWLTSPKNASAVIGILLYCKSVSHTVMPERLIIVICERHSW